jgi:hypothetical protein
LETFQRLLPAVTKPKTSTQNDQMKPKLAGLLRRANAHPVITILLALLLFGSIPFIIINSPLIENPYAWAIGGGITFALGIPLCIGLWKNTATVIVIAALLASTSQSRAEEQKSAVAVGVGVVVICVGAVCGYKVYKFCQKKFPPKSTNAPPDEFTAAGGEYGGSCEYSSIGSCYTPPSLNASPYENLLINPTTFSLGVLVEPIGASVSMNVNNDEGTAQDWTAFQADMASHGLFVTGHPSSPQFELGGVPCDPSMVPLQFDQETGRVTHRTGGEMRRVTVERSPNLTDWSPLLVTDTGVGSGFKVVDTTREGQMFYRVGVSQP